MERLDPQRRELLEARMFGKKQQQQQQYESQMFTNNGSIYACSSGSESGDGSSNTGPLIVIQPAPQGDQKAVLVGIDKSRTSPTGKGRKRKVASTDNDSTQKLSKPAGPTVAEKSLTPSIGVFFNRKPMTQESPKSPISRSSSVTNVTVLSAVAAVLKQPSATPATPILNLVTSSSSGDFSVNSRSTQTDLSAEDFVQIEKKMVTTTHSCTDHEVAIQDLRREIAQLEKQLHNQLASEKKLKDKNGKSMEMIKDFLISQSAHDKKKRREESMRNRLRLGQFNTVRQGASFVEQWADGYAFSEVNKKLSEIVSEKEDLEKQKKFLQKRKPPSDGKPEKREKKPKSASSDDGFLKPNPLNFLSSAEYHEQEEIYRLRSTALKKVEQETQQELEKLERERNIHIRELKRIHNEDLSRFNSHPVLNDRYLLLYMIGKGGFSEVYKGFDLKDQFYVACKVHQLNKDWKEDKKANYIKHAVREYTIHRSLNHPRIVRLFDVFEIDSNSFVTVLEYCDGNDLDFMLKQQKTIPEKEARAIILQVVSALKYLNERKPPVIHYDLKPGNILLGSGVMAWDVKLTDFGLSKILPEDTDCDSMDLTSQGAGTYWYLPPECFVVGQEPPKISSKVDVWSVGIIFYQSLYGRKPFGHNLSQASILEQNTILKATNIDFPGKPAVSQEAKNFIRKCLTYKKDDRVDVFQLAEDPYLKPKKALQAAASAAAAAAGRDSTSVGAASPNDSSLSG